MEKSILFEKDCLTTCTSRDNARVLRPVLGGTKGATPLRLLDLLTTAHAGVSLRTCASYLKTNVVGKILNQVQDGHQQRQLKRIMRLTAILILSTCLTASAKTGAQTIRLDVKDAPLERVFAQIKKQSGYTFVYYKEDLAKGEKITLHLSSANIDEVLRQVLKDQPLNYKIVDKTIVIARKEETKPGHSGLDPESFSQLPPPIDITGKVTDENGNPLAGASVKVKGSRKGTTTNNDGVFTLKAVDDNATLEISYVGFETLAISVSNRSSIVTSLKQKAKDLNAVVIQKGYYTEQKRYSVGNATQITAEEIQQQPVQNPLLALQGRVPGVEITQVTGMNGGAVKVQIQGLNSIGGLNKTVGTDPLIVIDNVPYPASLLNSGLEGIVQGGSPLNYISPTEIETISVLKDADATAIYGSRAANGAIIITTKKGKAGKAKLNVNLQQGWGSVGHFVDMMNTRQYLDMRYEALINDGLTPNPSKDYDLTLWDTTRYTNWQKTLIGGTAKYSNINTDVSGGNTTMQYIIGGTFNRETTVFPGDFDDKRAGLHFSVNGSSNTQRFRIQLSGSYMYDANHLPGTDLTKQALLLEPDAPSLYNPDGSLNWAPKASGASTWTNPLVYTLSSDYNNTTKNLIANLSLDYNILAGLDFRSSFGYNNMQSDLYSPTRLETFAPEKRANSQRSVGNSSRSSDSWIIEPQVQYLRALGKGKIEALLGTSIQQAKATALYLQGSGYSSNLLMKTLTAAQSVRVISSAVNESKFNGLFGRMNYIWSEKYIINLTARRDGSSKFGDANKLHNFGSVGMGWIFSREKWIENNLSFLSFGKLRGSYGTTGNDQIGDFQQLSTYIVVNPAIQYQGITGLQPTSIPNPHLKWEETKKIQGGFDLGFLANRINIAATYSRNRCSNQLISYVIPSTTGFTSITENLPALVQNTSWEFTLSTTNVKTKNFDWTMGINLTSPINKLLKFPGIEKTSYASGYTGVIVGQPLGVVRVYPYAGVDPIMGDYQLSDSSGKALTSFPSNIESLDIGNFTKFYGGMQQNFRYRGFQLDINFQFVRKRGPNDFFYNNDGFSSGYYPGSFHGAGTSNQPVTVLSRWEKTGDNTPIARFTTQQGGIFYGPLYSDAWYSYNSSFFRVKNVSLSWQLPDHLLRKARLQNCLLYFRGENIVTFTKYHGIDPETGSTNLPPLRMKTIGVQLGL